MTRSKVTRGLDAIVGMENVLPKEGCRVQPYSTGRWSTWGLPVLRLFGRR